MLESLFNKVAGLRRVQHQCFPVNIVKFLRKPILKNICERTASIKPIKYKFSRKATSHFITKPVCFLLSMFDHFFNIMNERVK